MTLLPSVMVALTVTGSRVERRTVYYLAFFALNFAHLARCAAAILARADAERLRFPPALPLDFPATLLNASIALYNFERSAFNCANTAPRLANSCRFPLRGRFNCLMQSVLCREISLPILPEMPARSWFHPGSSQDGPRVIA
jgi:hypothetical protein